MSTCTEIRFFAVVVAIPPDCICICRWSVGRAWPFVDQGLLPTTGSGLLQFDAEFLGTLTLLVSVEALEKLSLPAGLNSRRPPPDAVPSNPYCAKPERLELQSPPKRYALKFSHSASIQ